VPTRVPTTKGLSAKALSACFVLGAMMLTMSGALDRAGCEERSGAPPQEQRSPPQPKELTVAPQALPTQTESPSLPQGPASICHDLVVFLQPKPPAPAQAPGPGAAPSAGGQAPQASGQSAPIPQSQPAAEPGPITLEEASGYAEANNLRACQEALQKMRRAGVALSPGLIALAALKPELLTSARP
jgi:hypothetical protein